MTKFIHFNITLRREMPIKIRKMYQSRTVAVDALPGDVVADLARAFLVLGAGFTTKLNVGVTLLSLKDRYVRKTGRDEATARMAQVDLEITGAQITPTHIFVQLAEYKGVTMLLRLNKATGFSTVTGSLTVGPKKDVA